MATTGSAANAGSYPPSQVTGSGAVNEAISGLQPNTTYHYRVRAASDSGNVSELYHKLAEHIDSESLRKSFLESLR